EIDPPDTVATTLGGLVTEQLGRLPVVGDEVVIGAHVAEVLEVSGRTVALVRMRRRLTPERVADPASEDAADTTSGQVSKGSASNDRPSQAKVPDDRPSQAKVPDDRPSQAKVPDDRPSQAKVPD